MKLGRYIILFVVCVALTMLPCQVAVAESGGDEGLLERFILSRTDAIQTPQYPEDALDAQAYASALDRWVEALVARQKTPIEHSGLDRFVQVSAMAVLGDAETENSLYSPVSLWLALDVLAEIASSDSRAQILNALGEADMESLARTADALWQSQYWDDGQTVCRMGTSLWLNEGTQASPEALVRQRENARASVFSGDMRDAAYNQALKVWLNGQTGGLLSEQVSAMCFDPRARMAVCAALYCKSAWKHPFEMDTAPDVFHAPDGDVEVDFMRETGWNRVYRGARFSAIRKALQGDGAMVFILPEEGVHPTALLNDDETFAMLFAGEDWQQVDEGQVNLSVPKLDMLSVGALSEELKAMGITDIFDEDRADFSESLVSDGPVSVFGIDQYARLTMDEEGVEAAAITVANVVGAIWSELEPFEFKLDRPFLLALMGVQNVPLFIGIVNNPQ